MNTEACLHCSSRHENTGWAKKVSLIITATLSTANQLSYFWAHKYKYRKLETG